MNNRGSSGEGTMSSSQAAVPGVTSSITGVQAAATGGQPTVTGAQATAQAQSNTSASSAPEPLPSSGLSDLKLFYFNKPDSDHKSPTSISLSNGVNPKVVQIPSSGATPGGYAYVGTIIKQGKDVSEGQKVLLTPVIKDGGRFILPRSGGTSVRPSMVTNTTTSSGQIILSQTQSPRRSFVIHNTALSGKDLKSSKVESGTTVVPKILPPPKVPLVVCASRPHDVTLTSVKPLALREDSLSVGRQAVDVSSLMSPNRDSSSTVALRDLPPLTPISPTPHSTTTIDPQTGDHDDVELVGDGDMPRPIVKKTLLLTKPIDSLTSPSSPISIPDSPSKSEGSPDIAVVNQFPDKDSLEDDLPCDEGKANSKEPPSPELIQDKPTETSIESKANENSETKINHGQSLAPTCKLFVSSQSQVSNEALKKLKGDRPSFKVSSSNGHFVRILSTCSSTEARELTGKHVNALLLKDGKAVVLGTLTKDSQSKDSLVDGSDKTDELNSKGESVTLVSVQNKVQKTFPLVVSPTQETKNSTSGLSETPSKHEESPLPKPMFNVRGLTTLPSVIGSIHFKDRGLEVKELSKEGAMLERSRKRKGAPVLRDCFRKTIAVKRLEPLTGAASIHPLQVIDWDLKSRIGTLPGSEIKFVVNSYGALQVYEGEGMKQTVKANQTTGVDVVYTPGENSGKDDIGRCIECECYGLLMEFIEERFCSFSCKDRNQTRKALITKRSLGLTKENTNKKRRLLEMALNKTRPTDENDNNNKIKPLESRISKHVLVNSLQNKDLDKNDKSMEVDSAESASSETTPSSETKPLPSALTALLKQPVKNSEHVKNNQRLPVVSTDSKEDSTPTSKATTSVERKPLRERRVSIDTNSKVSTSTNTLETVVERKVLEAFDWCEYLSQMRSHPAWVRLFKDAFPSQPNLFRVGHRLEAVDPQRPSLFCAVSVSQVKGYRIKLHFDGYGKAHDFWLNADSPNIFPCGFCQSHGIELEPPWGFNKQTFNWSQYLTNIKARPAPPKCFIHKLMDSGEPNLFKVGMKLEAVDKKNSFLVCVATVAAVVDHRILIHFDSWDDSYDYWTEYYSPNIHPISWCQQNNYVLTPPNGHKRKNFSWRRYLNETGSEAAPDSAFMVRPPIKFKKGSKLEAVDPRAPHLLRVATIKQVLPYQVQVVFDGFPDHFGFWFDDDSPDLHPIGWSTRTGHPLTPPPKPNATRPCSTPGCHGDGNVSSGELETHTSTSDCPYSTDNLDEENLLPDRLSPRKNWGGNSRNQQQNDKKDVNTGQKATRKLKESEVSDVVENSTNSVSISASSSSSTSNTVSPTETFNPSMIIKTETADDQMELGESTGDLSPDPISHNNSKPELVKEDILKAACDKFMSRSLSMVSSSSEVEAQDLLEWDSRKVTAFVESLLHKATNAFYNNKVDGEGLLMLNEDDLSRKLSFNQLEASTIYTNIVTLRNKFALQSK